MTKTQNRYLSLSRLSLIAAAGLCLTACATSQPHSSGFGQATAQNRAVQEVAPTAEQKNNTYIPADANRQAIAREKYRNNTSDEPAVVSTR
jgi:type IV pilus biogenesis protein CpaD/CtpE